MCPYVCTVLGALMVIQGTIIFVQPPLHIFISFLAQLIGFIDNAGLLFTHSGEAKEDVCENVRYDGLNQLNRLINSNDLAI